MFQCVWPFSRSGALRVINTSGTKYHKTGTTSVKKNLIFMENLYIYIISVWRLFRIWGNFSQNNTWGLPSYTISVSHVFDEEKQWHIKKREHERFLLFMCLELNVWGWIRKIFLVPLVDLWFYLMRECCFDLCNSCSKSFLVDEIKI